MRTVIPRPVVLFLFLLFSTILSAQAVPNPKLTPGVARVMSKAAVCSIKWGKDERHVTQKMKDEVFAAYGMAQGKGACAFVTHIDKKGHSVTRGCEVDHSISRELAGADVPANLWPQSYNQHPLGASEKDRLENLLHRMVCDGRISLAQAQHEISHDWPAAYRKYVRKADVKLPR